LIGLGDRPVGLPATAILSAPCIMSSGAVIRVTAVRRHDELCAMKANVMRPFNSGSASGAWRNPECLEILAPNVGSQSSELGIRRFSYPSAVCLSGPSLAASPLSQCAVLPSAAVQPFRMGVATLHQPPTFSAWCSEAAAPLDRCRAARAMSYGVDEHETPAVVRMGGEARCHGADDT
jgi:hypothetical protein